MTNLILIAMTGGTLIGLAACGTGGNVQNLSSAGPAEVNRQEGDKSMNITIGNKLFTATLEDNPTTTKLRKMLPLTLDMSELNGNEKFFHLTSKLPTDASKPGMIQAGDLMLWGDNSLVVFYKSFRSSYSYTRLGKMDDPSGLEAAVGTGNVTIKFELK